MLLDHAQARDLEVGSGSGRRAVQLTRDSAACSVDGPAEAWLRVPRPFYVLFASSDAIVL